MVSVIIIWHFKNPLIWFILKLKTKEDFVKFKIRKIKKFEKYIKKMILILIMIII